MKTSSVQNGLLATLVVASLITSNAALAGYEYRIPLQGIKVGTAAPSAPADLYSANIIANLDFEGSFSDTQGHAYTATNVTLSGTSKSGVGSASFNGTGALVATSADLALGDKDFTVETWVNPTTTGHVGIYSSGLSFGSQLTIRIYSGTLNVFSGTASGSDIYFAGTANIPTNTWSHIAVVREGNQFRAYVNGQLDGSQTMAGLNLTSPYSVIGAERAYYFQGLMDAVRVTKGVARYSASFAP